jgi:flavin-dependent dehydrogenase
LYDAVIIGAGPAGAIVAALLAKVEREVVLVLEANDQRSSDAVTWVNSQASPLIEEVGLPIDKSLGPPFRQVVFYDAELNKSATPQQDQEFGYLVECGEFCGELVRAAVSNGAALQENWPVSEIRLKESAVEAVSADGDTIEGKVLLAAMGPDSPLIQQVAPTPVPAGERTWTAQVSATVAKGEKTRRSVAVVLGLNRQGAFGLVMFRGPTVTVSVSAPASPDQATELLASLCKSLKAADLLPVDLSGEAGDAKVCHTPAGTALDMDTHVGKHTLLIGDGGGFVAAASDETIYPAMWSAEIAADVVHRALASEHSQDVLMEFDAKWRMAMAEYLRPPNTESQFLIPLIFSRQPMADRMAAAFFCGENI